MLMRRRRKKTKKGPNGDGEAKQRSMTSLARDHRPPLATFNWVNLFLSSFSISFSFPISSCSRPFRLRNYVQARPPAMEILFFYRVLTEFLPSFYNLP